MFLVSDLMPRGVVPALASAFAVPAGPKLRQTG
jgi:hypothetical protein